VPRAGLPRKPGSFRAPREGRRRAGRALWSGNAAARLLSAIRRCCVMPSLDRAGACHPSDRRNHPGPQAPVTEPAAPWCPAWPRKIPPALAPSGDAHGNPGSYRLCRSRPSTRPGPGKTKYVRSPRIRGAAMCPHWPPCPPADRPDRDADHRLPPRAGAEPAVQRRDRVRRHGRDPARRPGSSCAPPGPRPAAPRGVRNAGGCSHAGTSTTLTATGRRHFGAHRLEQDSTRRRTFG
jgi:hypothetical protein